MFKDSDVVKTGVALYDQAVPYKVKIVRSQILYGTGDYEDPPEIREDQEVECFYIWYESPGATEAQKRFFNGGGEFIELDEAINQVQQATHGTIKWTL